MMSRSSDSRRAQSSLELLVTLGFGLMVLIPLVALAMVQVSSSSSSLSAGLAQSAAYKLASTATAVSIQSYSTKQTVLVQVPQDVQNIFVGTLNNTVGHQIIFVVKTNAGLTYVTAYTPANVSGYLGQLSQPGTYLVNVSSQQSCPSSPEQACTYMSSLAITSTTSASSTSTTSTSSTLTTSTSTSTIQYYIFGINTVGSTAYPANTVYLGTSTTAGDTFSTYLVSYLVTTTSPMTLNEIDSYWTYVSSGSSANVALYSSSSSLPSTLLATSTAQSVAATGWQPFVMNAPMYLSAGPYFVAAQSSGSGFERSLQSAGSGSYQWRSPVSWGAFPTSFGSSTAGAYVATMRLIGTQTEGYAKCTKAAGAAGTADSVSFYAHNSGDFRLAIYSDSNGPSSKLWESGSTAVSGAPGWQTVSISAGTPTSLTTSATTYWLCWQVNTANSVPSYSSGSSGTGNYIAQAYGSFPSSWTGGTGTSEDWSEYVTYH